MINYSVTNKEHRLIISDFNKDFNKQIKAFNKNLTHYCNKSLFDLACSWAAAANLYALFNQLKRDGLVNINKEKDFYHTFEEYKGDSFCPIVNSDIEPSELKKQERKERTRFNKGVFYFYLIINGNISDSIGGFIGNDFYGSGYDTDFYSTAIDSIRDTKPEYYKQLKKSA